MRTALHGPARWLSTFIVVMALAALAARAPARRVGDGGEYIAMASNLARLSPPALSLADLVRVERRLAQLETSFGEVALRFPDLRSNDGRQDFPHFWMYPLLAAPGLAAADAFGWHPNTAFVIVNVLCVAVAWWVAWPRLGAWLTVLLLGSPLAWWVDKAHGDVFTYALLSIALACLGASGGTPPRAIAGRPDRANDEATLGLLALGLACAQNPPLAVTFPFVVLAFWMACGRSVRAIATGVLAGASLVLLPFSYYYSRLGVPTPLVGWTSRHVPSAGELGTFLWDPNIGLAWAFPAAVLATIGAVAVLARREPRALLSPVILAGPTCALALLAGFAQSVNINHGATPGVNRWTLWLVPLMLPLWMAARRMLGPSTPPAKTTARALILASAAWSLWTFAPGGPENYRTATPQALWLWQHWPALDNPPLEIFAERVSRVEPPLIPVATAGCTKALVADGRWPVPCVPQALPPICDGPGRYCYANQGSQGMTFLPVSMRDGFDVRHEGRAWPTAADASERVRTMLRAARACDARNAGAGEDGSILRGSNRVDWVFSMQCEDAAFLYVARPREGATLSLRLPRSMRLTIADVDDGRSEPRDVTIDAPWAATSLDLPAARTAVIVEMR